MKTPEEYLNSKGFYNTNRLNNCFGEEITITDMLREYALEAVKADRERIIDTKVHICEIDDIMEPLLEDYQKEIILNLPIELK